MDIEQIALRVADEMHLPDPNELANEDLVEFARRFLAEVDRQRAEDGWQLVPKDYTNALPARDMYRAFTSMMDQSDSFNAAYKAMLAAAPKWEEGK